MQIFNLNLAPFPFTGAFSRFRSFISKSPLGWGKRHVIIVTLPSLYICSIGLLATAGMVYLITRHILKASPSATTICVKERITDRLKQRRSTQVEQIPDHPLSKEAVDRRNAILSESLKKAQNLTEKVKSLSDFQDILYPSYLGLFAIVWHHIQLACLDPLDENNLQKNKGIVFYETVWNTIDLLTQKRDDVHIHFESISISSDSSDIESESASSCFFSAYFEIPQQCSSLEEKIQDILTKTFKGIARDLIKEYFLPLRTICVEEFKAISQTKIDQTDKDIVPFARQFVGGQVPLEDIFDANNPQFSTTLIAVLSFSRALESLSPLVIENTLADFLSHPLLTYKINRLIQAGFKIVPYCAPFLHCCSTVSKPRKQVQLKDVELLETILKQGNKEKESALIFKYLEYVEKSRETEEAILNSLESNKHPVLSGEEEIWISNLAEKLKRILIDFDFFKLDKRPPLFKSLIDILVQGSSLFFPSAEFSKKIKAISVVLNLTDSIEKNGVKWIKKVLNQRAWIDWIESEIDVEKPSCFSFTKNDHEKALDEIDRALNSIDQIIQHVSTHSPIEVEKILLLKVTKKNLEQAKVLKILEHQKNRLLSLVKSYLEKNSSIFAIFKRLKDPVIIKLIDESFSLLSYPQVAKHWICTIIDLLMSEFETNEQLNAFSSESTLDDLQQELMGLIDRSSLATSWSIWGIMMWNKLFGQQSLSDKIKKFTFQTWILEKCQHVAENPQIFSKKIINLLNHGINIGDPKIQSSLVKIVRRAF